MPIEFAGIFIPVGSFVPAIIGLVAGTIILKNRRSKESSSAWAIGVLAVVFGAVSGCYALFILLREVAVFR